MSRYYKNIKELNSEIARDLKEMGVEYKSATVQDQVLKGDAGTTYELCPYTYTLGIDRAPDMLDSVLELIRSKNDEKSQWVYWEADERKTAHVMIKAHRNPGFAWKHYASFWSQFLHDGKFSYQYAERIGDQLPEIIKTLRENPNSRQAIMSIYHPEDLSNNGGKKRVPCSLQYHFLIREGKLKMMYYQRSCDYAKFFLADVYFAISMGARIAEILKVEMESLTHVISSLHVFKSDVLEVF